MLYSTLNLFYGGNDSMSPLTKRRVVVLERDSKTRERKDI